MTDPLLTLVARAMHKARFRVPGYEPGPMHPHDEEYCIHLAQAALSVILEQEGWRPIEEAPKNGAFVDLWGSCNNEDEGERWVGRFPNCYWGTCSGGGYGWIDDGGMCMTANGAYGAHLTHFRPLPAPPSEKM